jgi:hypothetical protein
MVTLEDLQTYCKGKKIIIVGNCSDLLNTKHGRLIDNYEIVVRINRGYQYRKHLYDEYIGSKTTILSLGVKGAVDAARIIEGNSVNYILSPIIYSENLNYDNVYDISLATYNSLKESLNGNKPSTGISTYNFFNRFIDFARLDLIGFDFFETSAIRRNQLGHIKVNDHDGSKELAFFEYSRDPVKTILHKLLKTNGHSIPMNNIPTHNTDNQLFYKNNNQRR